MKAIYSSLILLVACGGGTAATKGGGEGETGGGGGKPTEPVTVAPKAEALDISSVKDDLSVFTDGNKHYIAVLVPDPEKDPPKDRELHLLYSEDGKTFDSVRIFTASATGLRFEVGFDDPRVPVSPLGSVTREKGKTKLTCLGEDVELKLLPEAEAKAMLGAATFRKGRPRITPFALSRDNDGVYTYIDSAHGETAKQRIFRGKPGAMKEIEVVNVEHDREWDHVTFGTKEGNLKADLKRFPEGYSFELTWAGKPALFTLDRGNNWQIIFEQLGVYHEGRSPTPCEPMFAKDAAAKKK